MGGQRINPAKVTKPIQLLAAWLAGLIIINGSFLSAAVYVSKPEWAAAALIVAAIVNVPIFLVCLFLLQTKFRPEMQEDEFYARYLEKRYSAETQKTEYVEIAVPQTSAPPVELETKKAAELVVRKLRGIQPASPRIAIND